MLYECQMTDTWKTIEIYQRANVVVPHLFVLSVRRFRDQVVETSVRTVSATWHNTITTRGKQIEISFSTTQRLVIKMSKTR